MLITVSNSPRTPSALTVPKDTFLTGWREAEGPRLWRMSLLPNADRVPDIATAPDAQQSTLEVFSAYDLPILEGLIQ